MCPLYPLHLVFTYGFLILLLWVMGGETLISNLQKGQQFSLRFLTENNPGNVSSSGSDSDSGGGSGSGFNLNEDETKLVTFYIEDLPPDAIGEILLKETSEDGFTHMEIEPDRFPVKYDEATGDFGPNNVSLSGKFLGFSKIRFVLSSESDNPELIQHSKEVNVKVHRESKTLDIIFIHTIIILVLLGYVNMGCTINLEVIKDTLRRPVAPAIGLASQYFFMPLFSYGIGYALFPSSPELWLGLFLTGCAPGGGGSNMWTYVLGGSLDLSITMTLLSTIFAFAALPLWVLALGPSIFRNGHFGRLPYRNIAVLVFGLVVPCAIGVGIRRYWPKAADFLKKMLKPFSIFFIVFIMTFGVYANLYLFQLFTWKVALAGFCLPFLGFSFGATMAILTKRKWEEVVAISIETGVQNTGLAIGVLKVALGNYSPLDDIAIVLPVAVATMTPVPLTIFLIAKFIRGRMQNNPKVLTDAFEESKISITNMNYIDTNGNTKNNSFP